MKIAFFSRKRVLLRRSVMIFVLALLLLFFTGVALGSSGGDQGPKGWVRTDTYRIMNFVVLAVVLFFLLRKPVSQALNGRIQGIKDQLKELEAKKKDAEKQLAQYHENLSHLDSEAEKIVEEYIRQGNEAKARILEEAANAAEKFEAQARRNIEHEFEQAKLKLQEEILEKALIKAEDIIKSNITTEDQDQLVDEYLEKVVGL